MHSRAITAIFLIFIQGCLGINWSYQGKNGIQEWRNHFPYCRGLRQSPVDIVRKEAKFEDLGQIIFTDYQHQPKSSVIMNTGHSVQVNHELEYDAYVSGTGLPGLYKLSHAIFHWGSDADQGSEHTIDGRQFPLEMQLVHFKDGYGTIGEALNHHDGIAVMSILFKRSYFDNPQLEPIVNNLKSVRSPHTEKRIFDKLRLVDILPLDTATFYRYGGSLTTPPCTEGVLWTVFDEKLPVSARQLNAFRTVLDAEYDNNADNFRSLQPSNGRPIFKTGKQYSYDLCFVPYLCPYVEDFLQLMFLTFRSVYPTADNSIATNTLNEQAAII